jgi:hypothetical protein
MNKSVALIVLLAFCGSFLAKGEESLKKLKKGEVFSIIKDVSGSIGYTWNLTGIKPENLVALNSIRSTDEGMPGAPVKLNFEFRVIDTPKNKELLEINFKKNYRGQNTDSDVQTFEIQTEDMMQ